MLVGEIAHGDLVGARVELSDQATIGIREREREAGANRAVEMDGLRRGRRRTRDEHECRAGGENEETPKAHRHRLRRRERNGLP